jgi:hypothetical protein
MWHAVTTGHITLELTLLQHNLHRIGLLYYHGVQCNHIHVLFLSCLGIPADNAISLTRVSSPLFSFTISHFPKGAANWTNSCATQREKKKEVLHAQRPRVDLNHRLFHNPGNLYWSGWCE